MSRPKHYRIIEVLDEAGISLSEAARFLPITRATLHNWKSGRTRAEALRLALVSQYADLIAEAVRRKKLPLAPDVPLKERSPLIKKILGEIKASK